MKDKLLIVTKDDGKYKKLLKNFDKYNIMKDIDICRNKNGIIKCDKAIIIELSYRDLGVDKITKITDDIKDIIDDTILISIEKRSEEMEKNIFDRIKEFNRTPVSSIEIPI